MLTVRPKISELTFRLFGRSLHPELFDVFAKREIERCGYKIEYAITSAGHLITWKKDNVILTEVSAASHQPFPQQRQIFSHPLTGQNQDQLVWQDLVHYQVSFSLEPTTPKTFAALQNHLIDSCNYEGLVYQFQSSGRMSFGGISYIDIHAREKYVRLRSFHTFPDAYAVVKSESTFTLLDGTSDDSEPDVGINRLP